MLQIVPLKPAYRLAFEEMICEFKTSGEERAYVGIFSIALQGFDPYYALLDRMRRGGYPESHNVPMDPFALLVGDTMIGEIFVRRRLSKTLYERGGHIGYKIRPAFRKRGFATKALQFGLSYLHTIGVARALLTCKIDNHASSRVIEKCGGVRLRDSRNDGGEAMKRFVLKTKAENF